MKFKSIEEAFAALNEIYKDTQGLRGDEYLKALLQRISEKTGVPYVFIGRPKDDRTDKILTDFVWKEKSFVSNFEYDLKGTPCEVVLRNRQVCMHRENVFAEFPNDLLLRDMGIEAYVGSPIITPENELIGIFVLLDTKKFVEPTFLTVISEFFANTIGVEISRRRHEEKLQNLNSELEIKVKLKTKEIKNVNKALEEKEKLASLGRVMAGIAHEIRNPLNLIINSGILAKTSLDELQAYCEKSQVHAMKDVLDDLINAHDFIYKNGQRIQQITTEMLAQSADQEKNTESYNVIELVEQCLDMAMRVSKDLCEKLELKTEFNIKKSLKLDLTIDIQSVFINIFENALASIETTHCDRNSCGGGVLDIKINSDSEYICISVEDDGHGIKKKDLKNIFEPFFTTKLPDKGTGLGLSLVKSIVDKNEGEISVESEEGKFTRFNIKLKINP